MSTQNVYRFALREHWALCLLRGFAGHESPLMPAVPYGDTPQRAAPVVPLSGLAVDRHDRPIWRLSSGEVGWMDDFGNPLHPIEVDEVLAKSERLILERDWLWAFGK